MKRRPFLMDCDTGTDDAIALVAALYCPEIELRAITSVNGNVAQRYTSQNNLDLVEYLGKDIPVARGAVWPIMGPFTEENASSVHGSTGLGDLELPKAGGTFDRRIASELIYETAVEAKGELELLVTGPMTNVAIALLQHRDLPGLIRHIWFMGGAARGGNVTPTAEFNIWVDPEAAHIVLQSGIPMTMVGLDVTERAVMVEEDAKEMRDAGTRAGQIVARLLEFMFCRRDRGGEDACMHDALALAAAVCPRCLKCEDRFVDVECRGTYSRGHTFVDRQNVSGQKPNVSVALEIDTPMFRKWLVEMVKSSVKE